MGIKDNAITATLLVVACGAADYGIYRYMHGMTRPVVDSKTLPVKADSSASLLTVPELRHAARSFPSAELRNLSMDAAAHDCTPSALNESCVNNPYAFAYLVHAGRLKCEAGVPVLVTNTPAGKQYTRWPAIRSCIGSGA